MRYIMYVLWQHIVSADDCSKLDGWPQRTIGADVTGMTANTFLKPTHPEPIWTGPSHVSFNLANETVRVRPRCLYQSSPPSFLIARITPPPVGTICRKSAHPVPTCRGFSHDFSPVCQPICWYSSSVPSGLIAYTFPSPLEKIS